MKKVLFICSGNTCRSPMAEGIAKKLIKGYEFGSAGLAVSPMEAVAENAVCVSENHGIDISSHKSRGLTAALCRETDIFVCMTDSHRAVLKRVLENLSLQKEIYVLAGGIADPYMGDYDTYEKCFYDIKSGIYRLFFNSGIYPIETADSEAVAETEAECFSAPWSASAVSDHIKNSTSYSLAVKKSDGELLGYITSSLVGNDGEIYNIAVKKEYRNRGLGRILLYEYFDGIPCGTNVVLEVRKSNSAAIKLYESMGFTLSGTRREFYTLPREDALIYTKRKDNLPCMY